MLKTKMRWPPAIFHTGGKTYAVGGNWVEIPDGTTREDLFKYVTYEAPQKDEVVTYQVVGSRGSTYTVSYVANKNKWKCTCPGARYRTNQCKHIRKIMEEQND